MAATFPPQLPDGIKSLRFYVSDTATAAYSGKKYAFKLPSDASKRGWAYAIRIRASGGTLTYSFDGTNDHGTVQSGGDVYYYGRHEGGIAVKGLGVAFKIEAW